MWLEPYVQGWERPVGTACAEGVSGRGKRRSKSPDANVARRTHVLEFRELSCSSFCHQPRHKRQARASSTLPLGYMSAGRGFLFELLLFCCRDLLA